MAAAVQKPRSKSFLMRRASKKTNDPHAKQNASHPGRSASLDTQDYDQDSTRPVFNAFSASIIPDPLNELPTWYHREVEAATAHAAQFRIKYPLHNPVGPRWYRNHHLRPPRNDGRPPSVFSPSFPPMASAPERGQDPSRMAGPSRTPSGSPLPTPSSSQIRIQEPIKPRSRDASLDGGSSPDGVDNWSRYPHSPEPEVRAPCADSRLSLTRSQSPTSPIPPSPNHFAHRPRRASMTHGPRHKTMTPSPLSQSTSAVHLSVVDPHQIQLPRKLSKRRKPFAGLFSGDGNYHLSASPIIAVFLTH